MRWTPSWQMTLALEDVDGVSLSAHKIGGPVGVGALVLRSHCPFRPREFGGGQEGGRRPGTQDVRGALAFAAVTRFCSDGLEARRLEVESRAYPRRQLDWTRTACRASSLS